METVREMPPGVDAQGARVGEKTKMESSVVVGGSSSHRNSLVRAGSTESSEILKMTGKEGGGMYPYQSPSTFRQPVPPFPQSSRGQHFRSGVPPKTTTGNNHLQSVVTTSFSVDDNTLSPGRFHLSTERREVPPIPLPWQRDQEEERMAPPASGQQQQPPTSIVVTTPSARNFVERTPQRTHSISRSYSATTVDSYNSVPAKRNYFHHVQSNQPYRGLPPDFIPPKRTKSGGPLPRKKEIILAAAQSEHEMEQRQQQQQQQQQQQWYSHAPRWESQYRDMPPNYSEDAAHARSQSFPSPRWHEQKHHPSSSPMALHSQPRYSSSSGYLMQVPPPRHEEHPRVDSWGRSAWYPHQQQPPPSAYWESRHDMSQKRDDVESGYMVPMHCDVRESFDEDGSRDSASAGYSDRNAIFRQPPSRPSLSGASHPKDKMKLVMEAASFTESQGTAMMKQQKTVNFERHESSGQGLLLAMPEDKVSLSETLCVVRENIEVFRATQSDVDAPAPGRKHSITVGQVGLRCIHCRHTTKASDRVKRANCYPSSIKRIYRTVIDMKLDHFSQCKFVPASLKQRLDDLKSVHTRSTGTTMQYFIKSARALGMEDAPPSGVRLVASAVPSQTMSASAPWQQEAKPSHSFSSLSNDKPRVEKVALTKQQSGNSVCSMDISKRSDSMASGGSFDTVGGTELVTSGHFYDGIVPLALPEDTTALSPLRCFLRAQVCAFSATESDIAVRAPTTFSIALGQVGIGCVHCVKQPPRLRSNRAVCFPFSIGRIYQSVADIQRFHIGECKNLPADVRQEFVSLQSASSKGSKGLATRQYWVTSAKKLGMVDTPKGIRFIRDPAKPQSPRTFSLDILAQAAFSVTTTSKKLVLPEDKDNIAEFLYVVMEQLQPCRFTEADRNKRRLKDVGCIGVECKHCAGQVDSRKFFWSSVSAVESNFVSVHGHMFECKMVPDSLKERLTELKKLRKEQTAKLMTGSQKAFFRRVWERLHDDEVGPDEQNEKESNSFHEDDDAVQKMEV